MAGRFIKLYDKILKWEWYKNINVKVLFLHLLLKANYKDLSFEGHTIQRGQLVTSLPSLSAELGLSTKQIRGSLDHLIATGEVTSKSYPRYRVITIVHYDDYQANDSQDGSQTADERAAKRQSKGSQRAGSGQAEGSQRAASIEYIEQIEKDRNIEQIDRPPRPAKKDELQENGFEAFWMMYPRKVSKQDAMNAWKKIKPDVETVGAILAGLSKWKGSDQWTRDDGRYIQYPATWLNKRMWEDDVQPARHQEPAKPVKPVKTVTAQQYEQRDYSSVDQQIQDDLDREMEEYMRREAYGR
jgi:hypothetical protein